MPCSVQLLFVFVVKLHRLFFSLFRAGSCLHSECSHAGRTRLLPGAVWIIRGTALDYDTFTCTQSGQNGDTVSTDIITGSYQP
jgi:hypothetical protein